MTRLLLVVHRYLGIGVGLLMSMWCLSGLVMIYVGYPALDPEVRLAHLAPIDWRGCCRISPAILGDTDPVSDFRLEMLGGHPVLDWGTGPGSDGLIDLTTGMGIDGVSASQAASVAAPYGPAALMGMLDSDQWTLEGVSPQDRPLYHFDLGDGRGGELYVSSSTGRAVQLTTRRERFWNWLGAVPHWLYFADLRRHAVLWSQLVIYTSLMGCFLTTTGLYTGVQQLARRSGGRWSPYRGFKLWHHLAGLLFGVFALTWVLSGLLSMNPWGLLEGSDGAAEAARVRGPPIAAAQLRGALRSLAAAAPVGVVSIQSAPLGGKLYLIASSADGRRRRVDTQGVPAPLGPSGLKRVAAALHGDTADVRLLMRGDDYYFNLPGSPVALPVWRVTPRDATGRRFYIDPVSGELAASLDPAAEHYRWWHDGLHRLDFAAAIRDGPWWYALLWVLMTGVTALCLTGTYLGYRRLTR